MMRLGREQGEFGSRHPPLSPERASRTSLLCGGCGGPSSLCVVGTMTWIWSNEIKIQIELLRSIKYESNGSEPASEMDL